MRAWATILEFAFGIWLAAGSALAAPRGPMAVVIDRGLHRQWIVVRDDAHPERPPRLVEVPWSDARAAQEQDKSASENTARREEPLVRPGMIVAVVKRTGDAEWHLTGTALEAGWGGDTVLVQAGLHAAAVRGIVRGAALVELLPRKASH